MIKNIKNNKSLDKTIYVKDLSNEIKKYDKKKNTKKILIISLSILLILLVISLIYYLNKEHKEQVRLNNIKKEQEIINNISSYNRSHILNINKNIIISINNIF